MFLIIGLSGKAGSGKNYLVEQFTRLVEMKKSHNKYPININVFQMALGDFVREDVKKIFPDFDIKEWNRNREYRNYITQYGGKSWREIMQRYGTEFGRWVDPLLWCKKALNVMNLEMLKHHWKTLDDLGKDYLNIVFITDIRFENEVDFFYTKLGKNFQIWSIQSENNSGEMNHSSESNYEEIQKISDFVFQNDHDEKSIENFYNKVFQTFKEKV